MANTINTFENSDVRTTTIVTEIIGFDGYNQQVTGEVARTLNSIKSDSDHVPVVFTLKIRGGATPIRRETERLERRERER